MLVTFATDPPDITEPIAVPGVSPLGPLIPPVTGATAGVTAGATVGVATAGTFWGIVCPGATVPTAGRLNFL